MDECFAYVCVRVRAHHVHDQCLESQRASDPLHLKLLVVVNYYVGANDQIEVLCKSRRCF